MPDILIRGMEMPETCADCHDADLPTAIAWLGAKCPWAHGIIDPGVYDLRHERHPDCPLHELPEHGDLISRDEAVSVLQSIGSRDYRREKGTICDAIKMISHSQYVPTIVPASEGENANG